MVSVQMPVLDAAECGYIRGKLRRNKFGAYSERPNLPLVEEEAFISKYINGLGTNKNLFRSPDEARGTTLRVK
jgi:hypothetical protein